MHGKTMAYKSHKIMAEKKLHENVQKELSVNNTQIPAQRITPTQNVILLKITKYIGQIFTLYKVYVPK